MPKLLWLMGTALGASALCLSNQGACKQSPMLETPLQTAPSAADSKPELYSSLQTISVGQGALVPTTVFTAKGYFEAPNWSRDGQYLIFDQDGKIMKVSLKGGMPQPVDTGQASHCNGSHGLSPDGKWLAISCSLTGGNDSRVYIVPVAGGTPRQVTEHPFSYFHSWSPDGKTIAFARPHQGGGDFFSISVDGGPETRLTTSAGISDDPDYSPDGKYVYFNSDRSGATMQIWRMKPDGTELEQMTSDARNNWTPHPSPDGKWIVFLSYDKGVTGHPANKDIVLRLMSLSDRKITDLVHLVGGSGTINVPSWSPDSQRLAYMGYKFAEK